MTTCRDPSSEPNEHGRASAVDPKVEPDGGEKLGLASLHLGGAWTFARSLGVALNGSGYYGARQRPVDDMGLSVWPGDERFEGGAAVGLSWRPGRGLDDTWRLFVEADFDTGVDTASDDSARFWGVGITAGAAATF